MKKLNYKKVDSSFRDPAGFLFRQGDSLFRQINNSYKEDYDLLMSSGLYNQLVDNKLLISHHETEKVKIKSEDGYKIIKPSIVNFISYPYEWSFSQLKDAALITLKIQKMALLHGMTLKDSSAYNIQFLDGKPVLIDTLSFTKYIEGTPWIAYKQFCQHFLASLALMSYRDVRLNQLLKVYIDGIPLDMTSTLLPYKTKFKFSIYAHIHLHSKMQLKYSDRQIDTKSYKVSLKNLIAMIDNLEAAVSKLSWKQATTEWGDYYDFTNYSNESFEYKKKLVQEFIKEASPKTVWDLGANTGVFSRLASDNGINTIAFDIDPVAVEKNYISIKKNNEENILPLLLDLTNPSPAIGWGNIERENLKGRDLPDAILALALIHHLAISNNVPLVNIAKYFSDLGRYLIIEFVPKGDSQVKRLLSTRKDIFLDYYSEGFEKAFTEYYTIIKKNSIPQSDRVLYLMEKRQH